jgi:hypothetical protein
MIRTKKTIQYKRSDWLTRCRRRKLHFHPVLLLVIVVIFIFVVVILLVRVRVFALVVRVLLFLLRPVLPLLARLFLVAVFVLRIFVAGIVTVVGVFVVLLLILLLGRFFSRLLARTRRGTARLGGPAGHRGTRRLSFHHLDVGGRLYLHLLRSWRRRRLRWRGRHWAERMEIWIQNFRGAMKGKE